MKKLDSIQMKVPDLSQAQPQMTFNPSISLNQPTDVDMLGTYLDTLPELGAPDVNGMNPSDTKLQNKTSLVSNSYNDMEDKMALNTRDLF